MFRKNYKKKTFKYTTFINMYILSNGFEIDYLIFLL